MAKTIPKWGKEILFTPTGKQRNYLERLQKELGQPFVQTIRRALQKDMEQWQRQNKKQLTTS